MEINISVARSWSELSDWQVEEIAYLYLNADVNDFFDAYSKMVMICYHQELKPRNASALRKLFSEIPVSELAKETKFLLESTDFHRFPEIPGLIKPADRLGNITIRHFSTIDLMFHSWHKEKSILNLKKLVASLYRINETYDDLDLVKVDTITRNLPVKKMSAIALAYKFTRIYLEKKYPIIFPNEKESKEEKTKPVFLKKEYKYIPFDKTIIAMAMDEKQPLGKKQDVNNVRIYEFFPVLTESIIYQRNKAKQNERN